MERKITLNQDERTAFLLKEIFDTEKPVGSQDDMLLPREISRIGTCHVRTMNEVGNTAQATADTKKL